MSKLTSTERGKLPSKDFAGGKGKYPMEDKSHARNALARVAQFGNSSLKAKVRAKVHGKFPSVGSGKARLAKAMAKNHA